MEEEFKNLAESEEWWKDIHTNNNNNNNNNDNNNSDNKWQFHQMHWHAEHGEPRKAENNKSRIIIPVRNKKWVFSAAYEYD